MCLLGFSEREVWRMTPKKLYALFEKYCEWNGIKIDRQNTIDDIIPT